MREGSSVPVRGFTRRYEALSWLRRTYRTGLRLHGCRAYAFGDESATYEIDIEAELTKGRW